MTSDVLHDCVLGQSHGQSVLFEPKDRYIATHRKLIDDSYTMCVDRTAVDFLTHPGRTLPEAIAP